MAPSGGSRGRCCWCCLLGPALLACSLRWILYERLRGTWIHGIVLVYDPREKPVLGRSNFSAAGVARAVAAAVPGGELWPSGRGRTDRYGWSEHAGPGELSAAALAWNWSHPEGRFHTLTYGTALDSKLNVYLSAADGFRKFSPDGTLLWEHLTLPAESMNAPFLMDGMVFGSHSGGAHFALSAETGELLWSTRVSKNIGTDNGFVSGHVGMLVVGAESTDMEFNKAVYGINATSGLELWRFEPDAPVWNFMASFAGDGTCIFQDLEGRAYRLRQEDGALLWKAGGHPKSWTDGTASLGANGVVYAVNTQCWMTTCKADSIGQLSAYRLSDGELLWRATTSAPPNNAPAVGMLHGLTRLSVVQPIGQQVLQGAPMTVIAYDAETGRVQWTYDGPRQSGKLQRADLEGIWERVMSGVRPVCLPNGWSAPVIDAAGTVYLGNQDGLFLALRDMDGNGIVEGPEEVSSYDTGACFAGSAGPSIGPGLVAVASCDTLFVFRRREGVASAAA